MTYGKRDRMILFTQMPDHFKFMKKVYLIFYSKIKNSPSFGLFFELTKWRYLGLQLFK